MKFNPLTNQLYTKNNLLLKTLSCPLELDWEDLEVVDHKSKHCHNCQHKVIDTKHYTETAIQQLLKENPNTCLSIDLDQENIEIILNDINPSL